MNHKDLKIESIHLIFILILIFGGLIVGLICSSFLEMERLSQLDLILLPLNDSIDLVQTFVHQFTLQSLFILGILFLGTSMVGTIFIALCVFIKGFQIGLTCMMFIYTYQLKGIFGILLTLLPQVLLELLPIVCIAIYAVDLSSHVLYACINPQKIHGLHEMNRGLNYLLASFGLALVSSYLKATLVIVLIRFFNQF